MIVLVTTITDLREAPAALLAAAYHDRWVRHEAAKAQLKTFLRGPGKILRSQSPDMAEQELRGYTCPQEPWLGQLVKLWI